MREEGEREEGGVRDDGVVREEGGNLIIFYIIYIDFYE